MIIKFAKDGRNGACEYLQNGTNGDRNKKDKRIQLTLQNCNNIINKNIKEVEKLGKKYKDNYKHIIISFNETDFNKFDEQTLKNIAGDFVNMYMNSYSKEDFEYYAEAHIPKILISKQGERRHAHIHIFIPKYSVSLNKRLQFGTVPARIKELEIIKEILIKKYSLERTDKRKIINKEKHKQNRNYNNTNIKEKILDYLIKKIKNNEINEFDEMINYVNKKFGKVTRIASDKAKTKYITITLKTGKKIRLKGELFNKQNFKNVIEKIKNDKDYIINNKNDNKDLKELYKQLYKQQKNFKEYIQKRYYKNKNKKGNQEKRKKENEYNKINYKQAAEDFNKKLFVLSKLLNTKYKTTKGLGIKTEDYFFKKLEENNELLIANKNKNIYIKIREGEIAGNMNATDIKEQAQQMFNLLLAQNKNPLSCAVEGSLEFKMHFKKLQQEYLKQQINKNKTKEKETSDISI